jgi:acetolactate synthase-1/2/3 large subunit
MLRRTERPVLVLGHGSMRSPDHAEIVEFIRERRIPVLLTLSAKGAFPADDPLCYGMVGVSGNPSAVQLCQDADLVVLVGLGLNVMTRLPVLDAIRRTQTVYVNIDEGYIDRLLSPALKVIGDAGLVFKELRKRTSTPRHAVWRPERVITTLAPPPPDALGRPHLSWGRHEPALTMLEAVKVLKNLLPARSHLIVDAGNAGAVAAHVLPCPERGTFVTPLGMGGMGYAVAGAVGASLPNTGDDPMTTVVVAGDGALMMNGAEINTMVAYGLPIVIVVLNNGSHGMCLVRQQLFFESRFEAVEYPEVDAAAFARALAGPEPISVATVDSPASLAETFQRFVSLRRPALIDVRVRTAEIPTFLPFLAGPLRSGNRQGHGTH